MDSITIQSKVMEMIKKVIAEYEYNKDISVYEDISELGVNSIIFIKIATKIEMEFDFEFEDEFLDAKKFNSIQSLLTYVESMINK